MLSHRQATQTVAGVVMVSGSGEDSMTDMDSLNPTTPDAFCGLIVIKT